MRLSIRPPKAVFACELARATAMVWLRSMSVARVSRQNTAPKSLSVFTGWTKRAPATKEAQDWAYRSRTGALERMAARSSWSVTSHVAALSVSGCRRTGRAVCTRKQPRTANRSSAFDRLVARFGFGVRGIKTWQGDAIFHLLHDPGFKTFLFGRSRQNFL